VRAIVSAALELAVENCDVVPRIMVPMVCTAQELKAAIALIDSVAMEVIRLFYFDNILD
jgi:signal transduction protein with GAF and PtsI domain